MLQNTLDRGLSFLLQNQKSDGSFICLVSNTFDEYSMSRECNAIVPSNIVLSSLIHIDTADARQVKEKVCKFILSQKNRYWSFNYWFKDSPEFTVEPYPDDLDDTFCALAGLYEYDSEIFTGEVLANIITMLTAAEVGEGGPYNMWLVPDVKNPDWYDIDLVVNSNIAYFLSLHDIDLPNLSEYIDKSIEKRDFEFPYNTIYPAIYFISRFYQGKNIRILIDILLDTQDGEGKWENPLRTALATSSLLRLMEVYNQGDLQNRIKNSLARAIKYIKNTQNIDGSWSAYSFYYQMKMPDKTLFAGSPYITTALCLEAMNSHKIFTLESNESSDEDIDMESEMKDFVSECAVAARTSIRDRILQTVIGRFSLFDGNSMAKVLSIIQGLVLSDEEDNVSLLAMEFASHFRDEKIRIHDLDNPSLLLELCIANVYGWIAYTIYDDILDGNRNTELLSLANVALRESYTIFYAYGQKYRCEDMVEHIFDDMESANIWEYTHCNFTDDNSEFHVPDFGDYMQLARKSSGHMIGPLIIMSERGYAQDSGEIKSLKTFFYHYLIARQLNDDMHDWEEDLISGKINAVCTLVLNGSDIDHSVVLQKMAKSDNGFIKNIESLRSGFWNNVIDKSCDLVSEHIVQARKSSELLYKIIDKSLFENLLRPLETIVNNTLSEKTKAKEFIYTYSCIIKP